MSAPSAKPVDVTDRGFAASVSGPQGGAQMRVGLPAPLPNISGTPNTVVGNLLKGPVGPDGKLKDAALMVGIKLDLEAEVHLTARVRGDILVGLY
ncbi:hypothetical protein NKR23_g10216 [Pleurostoma richardsiae]|uniref:Uncharacterized protein n=1 Tax=Pleurostoma richardsiae TaxID=41990 RepID=A0AA38R3B0_9PEZI|nr:hypothetical protein NKR23_g10216 [Pleurostoma richardsiae]